MLQFSSYFIVPPIITLYDMIGRQYNVDINQEGDSTYVLNLDRISSGTYMVEVVYGPNRIVKRIIKE